jgi:hypothetical protein
MTLHKLLEILAAWPEGLSESMLRVHGVQSTALAELIGAQLAIARLQRVRDGDKEIERRIRITDKGRRTLDGR